MAFRTQGNWSLILAFLNLSSSKNQKPTLQLPTNGQKIWNRESHHFYESKNAWKGEHPKAEMEHQNNGLWLFLTRSNFDKIPSNLHQWLRNCVFLSKMCKKERKKFSVSDKLAFWCSPFQIGYWCSKLLKKIQHKEESTR